MSEDTVIEEIPASRYCLHLMDLSGNHGVNVRAVDTLQGARNAFDEWKDQVARWASMSNAEGYLYAKAGIACECNSVATYHEYPVLHYSVGPRGGIKVENG